MKRKVPTFGELLEVYPQIATIERMKCERPSESTVWNVVTGVRHIVTVLAAAEQELNPMALPLTWLTCAKVDRYLAAAEQRGHTLTTAWTYVHHLRALTARWTRSYYAEKGLVVTPFDLPVQRLRSHRYMRPDRNVLLRVRDWYDSLRLRDDKREWLTVTLMLEFAMRNSDVAALRWSDFRPQSIVNPPQRHPLPQNKITVRTKFHGTVLCYTPHKTSLTSGRIVAWPVHPTIWRQMCLIRDAVGEREGTHFQGLVVPAAEEVFQRLNSDIKSRHFFTGFKGLYELRKICIDHIYQRFGAEMASSISGDDIRTVTRYYADPSAVTVTNVRIVDLL